MSPRDGLTGNLPDGRIAPPERREEGYNRMIATRDGRGMEAEPGGDGAILAISFPARRGDRDPAPNGPDAIDPRDLIEASVVSHGGRMAGMDNGRLRAVLPSAITAVRCALAIQRALAAAGDGARPRIGVDLATDEAPPEGVGAGALEDLAHSGGISISAPIFARARTRFNVAYEELGPRRIAGHAAPVAVYRMLFDAGPPGSHASRREIGINPDRAKLFKWVGVAGFLVLIALALRPFILDRASPPGAVSGDASGAGRGVFVAPFAVTGGGENPTALRAAVIAALAARSGLAAGAPSARGYRLEAETRGSGADAHLAVRLVEAGTGKAVWAADYVLAGSDMNALATDIAAGVADALGAGGG